MPPDEFIFTSETLVFIKKSIFFIKPFVVLYVKLSDIKKRNN